MNNDGEAESYTVRLANTSTPAVCSRAGYSQTACGTVIEFIDMVASRKINSNNSNNMGWKGSEIASWLNTDFYNKLPDDLKNLIIPTAPIVSGAGLNGTSDDITAEDTNLNKIYLESTREVGLDNSNDAKNNTETDTRILDYYIDHNTNEARKRIGLNIGFSDNQWFTRSAGAYSDTVWFAVVNGQIYSSNVNINRGIAPTFRIGSNH